MSASGVNRTILHVDDDPQITRLMGPWFCDVKDSRSLRSTIRPPRSAKSFATVTGSCCSTSTCRASTVGLQLLRRIKEYRRRHSSHYADRLGDALERHGDVRGGPRLVSLSVGTTSNRSLRRFISTFQKIEHWWQALHNLTRQRRQAEALAAAATLVRRRGLRPSWPKFVRAFLHVIVAAVRFAEATSRLRLGEPLPLCLVSQLPVVKGLVNEAYFCVAVCRYNSSAKE